MTILRELATEYAQDILVLDQQRAANENQIRQIVRRYSGAHPALVRGSQQR